jgi:hypothetical protein
MTVVLLLHPKINCMTIGGAGNFFLKEIDKKNRNQYEVFLFVFK